MENGWEMKCGLKWVCSGSGSNSSVPSTSEQFQHQEGRNQMNMNFSHCILPRDAPGSLPPHLKQEPTSNIFTFGSCKQNHHESASSSHSMLSVSPSLLQYDSQRQLNVHTSAQGNVGAISNWPSMQNHAKFNSSTGVDVSPRFPSRSSIDMDNGRSRGLSNDLDALSSLITNGGSKNASLQTPSAIPEKQNLVEKECPRVFCLAASGDLLLSSMGLLGILCSCHGMRMSVSKFCEHAGLSDVNPGYAVRMDSGESIAQWRNEYLRKFGIRAPGDHRGWDWSEGFLATSGLANSSMVVAEKKKVFDLSSLFTSSAEAVKITKPWNNLSSSRPQTSQEYFIPKDTQQISGHDHFNSDSSRRISKAMTDYPGVAYPTLRSLTPSLLIGKEGSWSDYQSRSFHNIPSHENSYSSPCQMLPHFRSKSLNNSKDGIVERGKISSSVDLKLGQSWGSEYSGLSAARSHATDDQTTIVQQKASHNLANAKVTDHSKQHIFCHSMPDFNRKIEPFQAAPLKKRPISFQTGPFNNALAPFKVGPPNNAPTSFREGPMNNVQKFTNGAAQAEHMKDELHNSLAISTPNSSTNNSAGRSLYNKEISERVTNSHPFSPLRLQYQPCVDRSVLIDFACNTGDAPIRNLASPENKSARTDATCGHKDNMMGSLTICKGYAKQFESSGFTRNGICNSKRSTFPAPKFNPLGVANMRSSISDASEHVGNEYKHAEAINSHMSVESSRLLALSNVEKSLKEKPIDGSLVLNEPRIHSGERQENGSNADVRAQKLFLDQGPLRRQKPPFAVGHIISSSFFPDDGHKEGMNLGAITETMKLLPELTEKYNGDLCHPQPKKRSSLSGRENIECECDMLQGCYGGSSSHFSGRCKNNVQTMCSKMMHDYNGSSSIHGLKKQSRIPAVETPKHSGSNLDEKATFLACSLKSEKHALTFDSTNSQCVDAPFKENFVSRMNCSDVPILLSGRAEAVANLKELSAEGPPRLNQEIELLKERELSDISSDCSVLAVTQASNEINIIDQGSAISRSCSSVEAIDSVRSSQLVCDDNTISTEEESLTLSNSIEFKQTHSKSDDHSGEMFNKDQNELGFKPRNRKPTTKWKMMGASFTIVDVSQLPSKSGVCMGTPSDQHASTSEDGQVLFQPNQNSSRISNVNSSYDSLKQKRSAMFSVKMISRKRGLNGMYNSVEGEPDDQGSSKGNNDFIDMPENAVVKKLKQAKHDETVKRHTKTLHNRISDVTFRKPVACGKYGIICDQESDIDIIKPPKIVPLSQVLKASKKQAKFEKSHLVPSKRKKNNLHCISGRKSIDPASNFRRTQSILYYKVQSGHLQAIDDSTLETQQMDLDNTHIDDPSKLKDFGNCEDENNLSVSTCQNSDLSKTKEARLRSLYELSMKGNKFISADISRSQNVMGVDSTVFESAKRTSGSVKRDGGENRDSNRRSCRKKTSDSVMSKIDESCCVCGISDKDDANWLLECGHCLIKIHQACYGISRVPKGEWYCRPCRTSSKDVACVLCGYGGGAMTRAFGSRYVVKGLLKAWDIRTEPHIMSMGPSEALYVPAKMECRNDLESATYELCPSVKPVVHNSIISGLFDPTVKQWVHMVCGLWTPGTRCPNVDTMSAFDVSDVSHRREHMVCYICKRTGGSCIKCRVETCSTQFHPWCAHQKGLLQSEVEGVDRDEVGFYGRCLLHAESKACHLKNDDADKPDSKTEHEDEPTCARTKGYQGRKQGHGWPYSSSQHSGKSRHLVSQVQLDAWHYINAHKLKMNIKPKPLIADVDQDYRKEYARYKQAKGWKHLIVYKSGIHALGLYTSRFIQRGAMVVEYIGEIVGPRVADKRESEYLSGRKLQYKSACYFFRIDKEQIIDATCKGGIARFVNHSCQPNCVAKVLTIRGEKKVVFLAQREINPGEEITYDYHFNHEDEGKKIPCFCNSKNCRRYLN